MDDLDNDSIVSGSENGSNKGSDDDFDASDKSGSEGEDEDVEMEVREEVTEASLEAKLEEAKAVIKVGREQLSEFRRQKKEATDALSSLKKKEVKTQREKNAFCSLSTLLPSYRIRLLIPYTLNRAIRSKYVLHRNWSTPN